MATKSDTPKPDADEFRKLVEKSEREHGITDCVYVRCVREFENLRLHQLNEHYEVRILKPFLLTWGVMGRVLGYKGVTRICEKLLEISKRVESLRRKKLLSENLTKLREQIIRLFDEVRETKFESNGKEKEVGSTAASKVLHLACPDLFVMWDRDIRTVYKKRSGDGKDYFEFLIGMKRIWEKRQDTIKELQDKYGKRETRIIDQYNWMKAHE